MTVGRNSAETTAVLAARTFGLKLALVAVATVSTVLVSRILGPEGRGIYYTPLVAALVGLALIGQVTVTVAVALTRVGVVLTWLWTLRGSVVPAWSLRWDPALIREAVGQSLVLHAGIVLFFLHLRVDALMVKGIS